MNHSMSDAKSIFLSAIEQHAPSHWPEYLESACGDDRRLRAKVDRLLQEYERLGTFHEAPAAGAAFTEEQVDPAAIVGAQIGPYKLREQLGEGGMGVVYVAEQTEPVKRKVALKIIKWGMATQDVVSRFEAERQALAMMDHPNIAKVFDAGAIERPGSAESEMRDKATQASGDVPHFALPARQPAGQPYFVMELVQGPPITEFCDEHRLDMRQRLELFLCVCRAVNHAHQKGIIHRDLKPSNVLVPEIDGAPVPKVIDFGVAKAIDQKLTEQTVYTQFSQLVGTPLYMSPEQAGLGVVDVDTRSDVYSLGVLLYELLTGSTPFDSDSLKQAGFDEMRRIIREDDPQRPSARVSTLNAEAQSTVAQHRGSDARQLGDSLKGELDWIVMKSLEKDRNRRYESASAMAEDIGRHLLDEPITARPASRWYRARKFVRRNRVLVASTSAVIVALTGGLALATAAFLHAVDQREMAQQSADQATQAEQEAKAAESNAQDKAAELEAALEDQRVLTDVLRDMHPTTFLRSTPGRVRTVRDSIDEIARQIDEEGRLTGHPRVEIEVRSIFADSYFDVGEYDKFRDHMEKAIALAKQEFGEDDLAIARMHARLAYVAGAGGDRVKDPTSTLEHANEAIRIYQLHGDVPDVVYVGKAYSLQAWPERHAEAIAVAKEAVRLDGNDAVYTLTDLGNIWMLMGDANSLDRALDCFDRALKNYRQFHNPQNHLEANLLWKKARCHRRRNEFEPARATYQAAYDLFEPQDLRSEPEGHRFGLALADLHFAIGQVDRAFELVDEVEANARRYGVVSSLIQCFDLKGWLFVQLGDFDSAEPLLTESKRLAKAEYGVMHGLFGLPCSQLALMYETMGQLNRAAEQYRELQPLTQHFVDAPLVHAHAYWGHARGILAAHDDAALRANDAALLSEAERIADEGLANVRAWRQPHQEAAFHLLQAMIHRRRAADQAQRDAAIRELQEGLNKADQPSATLQNKRTYIVPTDRWQLEEMLVELLVESGRREEAHDVMQQAVAVRSNAAMLGPNHIQTILAEIRLGEFRQRQDSHSQRTAEELETSFRKLELYTPIIDGVRRRVVKLLIHAYEALGKPEKADQWRSQLELMTEATNVAFAPFFFQITARTRVAEVDVHSTQKGRA